MMPRLSICIPTYNGAQFLKKSLDGAIKERYGYDDYVEIVISDNASTDETEEVVRSFQNKHSSIIYAKNGENLGYDRNLDNAINMAHGEYCWLMSDDDIIQPGAIHYMLDLIAKNNDVAYFCVDVMMNNLRNFSDQEIIVLHNGDELLEKHGLVGGLISQNIFRRGLYPKNVSQYFGNLWLHMSIVYDIIVDKKIILINKGFIKGQREECRWAKGGKGFITFTNLKIIIESFLEKGYNKAVIDKTLKNHIQSLSSTVFFAFLNGLPNTIENRKLLRQEFSNYSVQYFLSSCIFRLPNFFFVFSRHILGK